ncbi:MAG: cardiolipin synthase, partial [Gammaproteobacteria bacterium]|nr:cardiolipin synthase [Gammaproteobacteria bacterium]
MTMNGWFPRITLHSLVVLASVLLYVLTTRVERERRPPAVAISWVLGMIALPYLVLPMYLLFGRRKMSRRNIRWSGIRSASQHWAEELIESFGLPAAAPAATQMHQDGRESAAALFMIIAAAKSRLDICTYILGNDTFGRDAMQRLIGRARQGIQVRVLIDGVGAMQLPRACFKQMESAGI